jgi:hypothetical protein
VYHQQPERLSVFFGSFGVVCAVRTKNGARILAVQLAEPAEAPVYIYVVNKKVSQAVQGYSHTDEQHPEMLGETTSHVANHGWNSKNEEEAVVLLEKTIFFMLGLVVVSMPVPEETMHDEFVGKPGHEFHADISCQRNKCVSQPDRHNHSELFKYRMTGKQQNPRIVQENWQNSSGFES